jgi:hypothetical protein
MIGNLAYSSTLTKAGDADQRAAEAAVTGLGTESPPIDATSATGSLDRICRASAIPPALLVEWGLFDANTGNPTDPDAVVMSGWAMVGRGPTPQPSARVVAVCGGKVVPCRVQWFRRPDLDALVGRPTHRVGFVAVVASREVPPGERVRLFVVSVSDPERVTELMSPGA